MTGTSQGSRTHRDIHPGAADWLHGADPGHWWVRLLDAPRDPEVTSPTFADMALMPLEVLVQAVRSAGPERMGQFVTSRFRDPHPANVLSAAGTTVRGQPCRPPGAVRVRRQGRT